MKQHFFTFIFAVLCWMLLPLCVQAHPVLEERVNAAVTIQATAYTDAYWSAPDAYGTPRIIKLARQGDVKALRQLTNYPLSGKFLLSTDTYGNNVFHVAKNADTVQTISLLLRHFYGTQAHQKITALVNAANKLGERPLNAQINAAHADTFRPLYRYTTLKQKNDTARTQLSRLRGMDERIFNQHKKIYCQEITKDESANGVTLLQAAQAQVPYHPHMAPLVQTLTRLSPCLTGNANPLH